MSERHLLVLSNDDGVYAEGMRSLHVELAKFDDVVVVAPLHEQSANSHSLTLARLDGLGARRAPVVVLDERSLTPARPAIAIVGRERAAEE